MLNEYARAQTQEHMIIMAESLITRDVADIIQEATELAIEEIATLREYLLRMKMKVRKFHDNQ